jgi:hypothetical protein
LAELALLGDRRWRPFLLCPARYFPAIGIRRVFTVASLQSSRPQISDFNFIPMIRRHGLYRRFDLASAWDANM